VINMRDSRGVLPRRSIRRGRPLGLMTGTHGIRAASYAQFGEHAAPGFGENQWHGSIALARHQE